MKHTAEIKSGAFSAPSCQLRVVAANNEQKGLLLGSTDTWTMRTGGDDQDGTASEGILLFQPHEIAPRSWKLDVREDDYPIVYIDKKIPDSRTWVRNDPVFVSCVLPAIIREVFDDILVATPPEQAWAKDWLGWADTLMPGREIPWTDGRQQKQVWVNDLLDSFCQRHGFFGTAGWQAQSGDHIMTSYSALRRFNENGLDAFKKVFAGQIDETVIDPSDPALTSSMRGTGSFTSKDFATAKDMAQAVLSPS